jgi:hypothetical protein
MLTAALRCPGKPLSADCEQRISEQIKSERYIFGWVTKGPQAGQVTAEVHLYQKNKTDTFVKESYSENLRDQNDDTVKKLAARILSRLGGNAVGVVVVRFGNENGEVIIDGDKKVPLQNGAARVELSPGSHSVEIAATGQAVQKRNVLVTAGKETSVDLTVAPAPIIAPPPKQEKAFPVRKVVGGGLAALGAVGVVIGAINFMAYLDDQQRGEDHQNAPNNQADPKLPAGKKASDVCGAQFQDNFTVCELDADAKRHSTIALVSGIAGGVLLGAGAYLFFTDKSSGTEKAAKRGFQLSASPSVGKGSGGLVFSGSF